MDHVAGIIAEYGHLAYPIIFLWTFFEGETIVIFGGYAAYYGIMDAFWLFMVAWFGSFFGDQTWYYIGRFYGPRLLKRFPRWTRGVLHVSELMHHYGVWFILSFRFVYGVRNVSSFAIGTIHYPRLKFLGLNFIAAGLWAASFVGFGYGFGILTEAVATQLSDTLLGEAATAMGLAFLALFLCVAFLLLRRQRRRLENGETVLIAASLRPDAPERKR